MDQLIRLYILLVIITSLEVNILTKTNPITTLLVHKFYFCTFKTKIRID